MKSKRHIKLSDLTTIGLGGEASEFVSVGSVLELTEALTYANKKKLSVWVLSGGSNTVFKDSGFDGLVIKIDLKGITFKSKSGHVFITAFAGENWDDLVKKAINKNLSGIESLSGIPGSVGATPVQNVGAYGQEVSDVITEVKALDRTTFKEVVFANDECKFEYRSSRFKGRDNGKYIITEVTYRLFEDAAPAVTYLQLKEKLNELFGTEKASLKEIRKAVLALRKSKSMVLDKRDPNSRSCGSFFMNPVLSQKEFSELEARWKSQRKQVEDIPFFETNDHCIKIPAAWLIEHAGFQKGHQHHGVGISQNHSLALVNKNGTVEELLELAGTIRRAVKFKFKIQLEIEPILAD
ncbi:UDP-N-acetylenolpyruvoylglucosamine reductase [bacterium CG10_46_32]|nr:MAG: UDP-N-acetylenolpyruvoylglucosamine reductase [bacterium CG10_46_32]PIP67449.1 MAG: hypothetical protein COW93_00065 [Parcubacteria group bacterium CG22_combo_CG10-13_8_21_14_all_41_9]PIR56238.1 MAG: UDP-N-acetylenolpyruvoylglucosamine reductase [Parcubacteria group bacterium CG10_big_fil_rev_8_21_14_0_10_46_32]